MKHQYLFQHVLTSIAEKVQSHKTRRVPEEELGDDMHTFYGSEINWLLIIWKNDTTIKY